MGLQLLDELLLLFGKLDSLALNCLLAGRDLPFLDLELVSGLLVLSPRGGWAVYCPSVLALWAEVFEWFVLSCLLHVRSHPS